MQELSSSVLIINHPQGKDITFGADFAQDLSEAKGQLQRRQFSVIVVTTHSGSSDEITSFLKDLKRSQSNATQVILVSESDRVENLQNYVNSGLTCKLLHTYDTNSLESSVRFALDEFTLIQQNEALLKLVNEQNETLQKLQQDLEKKVDKRQGYLESARKNLITTNERVEALHRALIAIHKAKSIGEMETLLSHALKGALNLEWIRIVFLSHTTITEATLTENSQVTFFDAPLLKGKESLGHIYFSKSGNKKFSKSEIDFLQRVSTAVALAIDRLTKLEQLETIKLQWETTFDSFSKPVVITNSKGVIIRTNKAFDNEACATNHELIGAPFLKSLFKTSYKIPKNEQNKNHTFPKLTTKAGQEVKYRLSSYPLSFPNTNAVLYVNVFSDLLERERMERQILHSAKMAELGTIGSSIAHEINNPLGGMLSFIQLIKMDTKKDHPHWQDIDEMEKGVLRCRDIVQNILSFTRKPDVGHFENISVADVIERSLKITELLTRSLGIKIQFMPPTQEILVKGELNYLSQALSNVIRNSIESISEKKKLKKRYSGKIQITLTETQDTNTIEIVDNGLGIKPEHLSQVFNPLFTTKDPNVYAGLGLTVGFQILKEHDGDLEISSDYGEKTSAKITLPRLVFS